MRAVSMIAVLAAGMVLAGGATARADEHANVLSIDAARSRVTFSVSHLYVQRVTASVPLVNGSVTLAPGTAAPAAVTAVFDPRRIATGDPDRDADLQGPDWFDTKRFPEWSFVSSSVTAATNGGFTVDGMLTVHGVAQPVRITATAVRGLPKPVYHGVATFDRHGFGMRVMPIDGLIGGDVAVTLDIALR